MVQAILASLGEAEDPDEVDYYTLNKEQPFHLDIDTDPDQLKLDEEEFPEDFDEEMENIVLEEEEKVKATESPLAKVHPAAMISIFIAHTSPSYVLSPTRLSRHLSADRNSGNAPSKNISEEILSAKIGGKA